MSEYNNEKTAGEEKVEFDNKTLDRIVLFIRTFRNGFPGGEDEHIRIRCRRLASILGWENTDDFLNFCEAVECGMQQAGGEKKTGFIPDKYRLDNTGTFEKASQFEVIYAELLRAKQNGECISLKELAVNGRDLMECGRSICESIMMDVMYEVPSNMTVQKCIITKEAALGNEKPQLVYLPDGLKRKPVLRNRTKKKAQVS